MAILVKDQGKLIADALLSEAGKLQQTAWGLAFARDGLITKMPAQVKGDDDALTLVDWKDNQETFQDLLVLYHIENTANPILEEDLQPITLLERGDVTVLVGVFDGPFDGYAVKDSPHTNVVNMVNGFLKPKIARFFKTCDGDVAKLMGILDSEDVRPDIVNACHPGGTIVLMPSVGEPLVFTKDPKAKIMPFGFTTFPFEVKAEGSFPEKKEEPKPVVALSNKEKLAAYKAEREAAKAAASGSAAAAIVPAAAPGHNQPPVADPPVVPVAPPPPKEGEEKRTMEDAHAAVDATMVYVIPDPKMSNSKAHTLYYRIANQLNRPPIKVSGSDRPPILVPLEYYNTKLKAGGAKIVDEKGNLYQPMQKPAEAGTLIGDKLKEAAKGKDLEPHHIPTDVMPRLGEPSIKFLKEQLKLQPAVTDEVLQGLEKKYPNYFQVGHPWEDVRNWSFANFNAVAADPAAISLLAFTMAAKLRAYEAVMPKATRNQEKVAM